jgi:Hsp20/alpha crystallin family
MFDYAVAARYQVPLRKCYSSLSRPFHASCPISLFGPHDFRRVYELDPSIDLTKIGAKIDDGILTVMLPKAETVKPRKISVQ